MTIAFDIINSPHTRVGGGARLCHCPYTMSRGLPRTMFSNVGGRPQLDLQYRWLTEQRARQTTGWTPEQLPLRLLPIGDSDIVRTSTLPVEAIMANINGPNDPRIDDLVLFGVDIGADQIYNIMQPMRGVEYNGYMPPALELPLTNSESQMQDLMSFANPDQFRFDVQWTDRFIVFMTLRDQGRRTDPGASSSPDLDYALCCTTTGASWNDGYNDFLEFRPSVVIYDPVTLTIVCRAWHIDGKLWNTSTADARFGSASDNDIGISMYEIDPNKQVWRGVFGDGTSVTEQRIGSGLSQSVKGEPARTLYDAQERQFGAVWMHNGEVLRLANDESTETTPSSIQTLYERANEQAPIQMFHYGTEADTEPLYRVEAWTNGFFKFAPAPVYAQRVLELCPEAARQQRTPSVFIFRNPGGGEPPGRWPLVAKIWMRNNRPWTPQIIDGVLRAATDARPDPRTSLEKLYESYNVERYSTDGRNMVEARQWVHLESEHIRWEDVMIEDMAATGDQSVVFRLKHMIHPVFLNLAAMIPLAKPRGSLEPLPDKSNFRQTPFKLAVGAQRWINTMAEASNTRVRIPSEIEYYNAGFGLGGVRADSPITHYAKRMIWVDMWRDRPTIGRNVLEWASIVSLTTKTRMVAEFRPTVDGLAVERNEVSREYWCVDRAYDPPATGSIYGANQRSRSMRQRQSAEHKHLLFIILDSGVQRFTGDSNEYALPLRRRLVLGNGKPFVESRTTSDRFFVYRPDAVGYAGQMHDQVALLPSEVDYLPYKRVDGTPAVMESMRTASVTVASTRDNSLLVVTTTTRLLPLPASVAPWEFVKEGVSKNLVDQLLAISVMYVQHTAVVGRQRQVQRFATVMTRKLDPRAWSQNPTLPPEVFLNELAPFVVKDPRGPIVRFPASRWIPFPELGMLSERYLRPTERYPQGVYHTVTRIRLYNDDAPLPDGVHPDFGALAVWLTDPRFGNLASDFYSSDERDGEGDVEVVTKISKVSLWWQRHLLKTGELSQSALENIGNGAVGGV